MDQKEKKALREAGLTGSDINLLSLLKSNNYVEIIKNSKANREYREYVSFTGDEWGMEAYDIVGYIVDGEIYCIYCVPDNKERIPIFAIDEWDHIPSCSKCKDKIDVNLIGDE